MLSIYPAIFYKEENGGYSVNLILLQSLQQSAVLFYMHYEFFC